ncbi:hypothetical protein KTT_05570 [Tengunoibacter tsumagoiensis]|uniref:Uncharacterized protein n=1 Tax=Tengunoibacter tsumagoiensis TaxID=2014871 RepID=A0A401ZUS2_9CHLR|nr:hypothetical protein KTT_05570 [Tengunoibacter tsumagoiensis]
MFVLNSTDETVLWSHSFVAQSTHVSTLLLALSGSAREAIKQARSLFLSSSTALVGKAVVTEASSYVFHS